MSIKYTSEQKSAIEHRGSALLVSAAAGSGKTKVLVERLLNRVEQGESIDEFLVITYTRAAAAELRERIYDGLLDRIFTDGQAAAHGEYNRRILRQSMICRGAPIGTIHSFCTEILRENAHLAGLLPDFRVVDEVEAEMIKAEILDEVLNNAYESTSVKGDPSIENIKKESPDKEALCIDAAEKDGSSFTELVEMASPGRDDMRLAGIILELFSKLQSDPNPKEWIEEQKQKLKLNHVSDIAETVWGAYIMKKARSLAVFWCEQMKKFKAEITDFPEFESAYGKSIGTTAISISEFIKALEKGWDEAKRFCSIDFPRPKGVSGYDELKGIRTQCKDAMKKLATFFECSSAEHIEDMLAVAPQMTALLDMIIDFDDKYSLEKRRRGLVDFSDLEHLTLTILLDPKTGEQTDLARSISKRYKEIMVDEYQDVNAVQEMIFNAVSQDGKNLFMVGDVKQSIYRFRLADPSIFLEKYNRYDEQGTNGSKILLSKNFRSRTEILEAVNFIFEKIMSVDFGEMDYTESERLIAGRAHIESMQIDKPVELCVIDMSEIEDREEENPKKIQIEAQYIAARIAKLTDGTHMIADDTGAIRPARYSDIVILLRSMRTKAWQYAQAMTQLDIPVSMPDSEGYFETSEISAALSMLTIIDNPLQDIELAAALSSPIYNFSSDELAIIRAHSSDCDFYSALENAANITEHGNGVLVSYDLTEKCAEFLRDIEELRLIVPDLPSDRFIWHMYNKTGLLEEVCSMSAGDSRQNNLIRLAEAARTFENNGYKGLFSFLAYVKGLKARGAEPGGDMSLVSGEAFDAVKIMSIHKSKGLEFPIVFLADTSKKLNNKDAQQPLVVHSAFGVGPKRVDMRRRIEYNTIARMAVSSKLTSEMMAEELRVLYVAMTRASEKLIITATLADAEKEIYKLSNMVIAPETMEEIKSMAGWIIAAHSGTNSASKPITISIEPPISHSRDNKDDAYDKQQTAKIADDEISELERISEQNAFSQGRQISAGHIEEKATVEAENAFKTDKKNKQHNSLPSKLTVTGMQGLHNDKEAVVLFTAAKPGEIKSKAAYTRPRFIKDMGLTAAERGIALHLAMQFIDFSKCTGIAEISAQLKQLKEKGLLTDEQAQSIDLKKIENFLRSGTGKRLLGAKNIWREFKFSLLYPAERFYKGGGEDEIMLQGVIDCFFEEKDELVIVDFKTDYVEKEAAAEKAKQYALQLRTYSEALEKITKKRVKERIIYFLYPNIAIDIGGTTYAIL